MTALARDAAPPLRWLCVDMTAVDDVDYSAAATLRGLAGQLQAQGTRLVLSAVADEVRAKLDRSGLTERLGEGAYFPFIDDVLAAYAP